MSLRQAEETALERKKVVASAAREKYLTISNLNKFFKRWAPAGGHRAPGGAPALESRPSEVGGAEAPCPILGHSPRRSKAIEAMANVESLLKILW
jgi:hypothetical protein